MNESSETFQARRQWWRDHFANGVPAHAGRILNAVAEETGVSVVEMRRRGRSTVKSARARQLAIKRLRAETELTWLAITALFNKRSHITIQRLMKKQFEPCSEEK